MINKWRFDCFQRSVMINIPPQNILIDEKVLPGILR